MESVRIRESSGLKVEAQLVMHVSTMHMYFRRSRMESIIIAREKKGCSPSNTSCSSRSTNGDTEKAKRRGEYFHVGVTKVIILVPTSVWRAV